MWKFDTEKESMLAIMKPYQHGIISMIQEKNTGLKTGDIHAALEMEGYIISRASVINYCKKLAANDVIRFKEATGKGGYHRIYYPVLTWDSILEMMHMQVLEKMTGAFPDNTYLTDVIEVLRR